MLDVQELERLINKIQNRVIRESEPRINRYVSKFNFNLTTIDIGGKDTELMSRWIQTVISFLDKSYYEILEELAVIIRTSDTSMIEVYNSLKYGLRMGCILMLVDDIPSNIAVNQGIIQHLLFIIPASGLTTAIKITPPPSEIPESAGYSLPRPCRI